MPKLPSLTPKKLLRILQKSDFKIDRIIGSHYILHNNQTNKTVVVPFHCKDLPRGTIYSILKSAGLSEKDL